MCARGCHVSLVLALAINRGSTSVFIDLHASSALCLCPQAASEDSMCADQSCGVVAVTSNTCPAATKIANDVFCAGALMSEDTSISKVCCEVDSISVVAIVAIVLGVAIFVCVAAGAYLFLQRKSVKATRHNSERKRAAAAATTPPPAPAPAPAPAPVAAGGGGVEMRRCVAVFRASPRLVAGPAAALPRALTLVLPTRLCTRSCATGMAVAPTQPPLPTLAPMQAMRTRRTLYVGSCRAQCVPWWLAC